MTREGGTGRRPAVGYGAAAGGVAVLVAAGILLPGPLRPPDVTYASSAGTPGERRGVPGDALQRTFGLVVPDGAAQASYLLVPGDGDAESGQDLYLRFRTTPEGVKEFVASLGRNTGDLKAGTTFVDQDDLDSVGLPWRLAGEGRLAGLQADLPEKDDTVGTALLTVDETDGAAPLVFVHVTV
ncbi:hypothetical protein ABZ490_16865 [Streptomyces sp. NPDC005811]|uniref:hypothetical protein n=1 Tax=Streptomyces sp. NPDC005811 TaxID=3154565 RepID=UPI0033EB5ACF